MPAQIAAWRSRLLAVSLSVLASSAWIQQCIKVGWLSSLAAGRVEEIQGSDVLQRVYLGHA